MLLRCGVVKDKSAPERLPLPAGMGGLGNESSGKREAAPVLWELAGALSQMAVLLRGGLGVALSRVLLQVYGRL